MTKIQAINFFVLEVNITNNEKLFHKILYLYFQ